MTDLIRTHQPSESAVMALQEVIGEMPQHDFEVKHHFSEGAYWRELFMPAGTTVVGKRHRHRHVLVISGHVTIRTDAGMVELEGFHVIESEPGMKRAIHAHKDTRLLTRHATTETDLANIEAAVIMPDDEMPAITGDGA